MTSEDDSKWSCDYCTFLNWPSAQKCTLCRACKPLCLIDDLASQQQTQDIYTLARIAQENKTRHDHSSGEDISTTEHGLTKWICQTCTYMNWPRTQKCVQCLTPKSKGVSASTSMCHSVEGSRTSEKSIIAQQNTCANCPSPRNEETGSKSIATGSSVKTVLSLSVNRSNQIAYSSNRSLTKSPPSSVRSPAINDIEFNEPSTSSVLDHRLIARKLQKWTCNACTYENWPKASQCVMCYTPKTGTLSRSPSCSPTTPGTGSDLEINTSGCNKRNTTVVGNVGVRNAMAVVKSPRSNSSSTESINTELGAVASAVNLTEEERDARLRKLRKRLRDLDWLWLNACNAVAAGVDIDAVEAYLAAGGDPARGLTPTEVHLLMRPGNFEVGHSLLHLAIRHHRDDLLTLLLSCDQALAIGGRRIKKVPCHVSPDLAADVRRQVAMNLRQRKGEFPCFFFTDYTTFSLPNVIYNLSRDMQQKLFDELLDRDVQRELEEDAPIINWNLELTDRLNSRLYALWNRTAGDCLLDSVLQATWGVFDSENSLRQALADSLQDAANVFYPRWKEYESFVAKALHFTLDEYQWARDWDMVLQLASKPGSALEQAHIFALAHVIRRPIIVYGIRVVKSFRGETIGFARFEGVYLPLLWEPSFCYRSPICLGYTRGHFSALVPIEPDIFDAGNSSRIRDPGTNRIVYLPLCDADGQLLPIHFLSLNETGQGQQVLRSWLDCSVTQSGLLVAKMKLHRQPPLVQQMLDDWIDYYHRLGQITIAANAVIQSRQQHQALSPAAPSNSKCNAGATSNNSRFIQAPPPTVSISSALTTTLPTLAEAARPSNVHDLSSSTAHHSPGAASLDNEASDEQRPQLQANEAQDPAAVASGFQNSQQSSLCSALTVRTGSPSPHPAPPVLASGGAVDCFCENGESPPSTNLVLSSGSSASGGTSGSPGSKRQSASSFSPHSVSAASSRAVKREKSK